MTIRIGAQLKDGWGRLWYVIDITNQRYTMRMMNNPGSPETFSKAEIKSNFQVIYPLDKPHKVCYNKGTNEREVIKMFYYEIRNTKTQETAQATAKNFATACRSLGWKPYDCRCVWKANPENACDPANY